MKNVYVFDHPLIQHKTAMIRDKSTNVKDFRELVKEIAMLMTYEAITSPIRSPTRWTPARRR